ncbi:hypothetical protein JY651_46835 [Pyxidicoccus parkwayensis]|uniref:Lipoprotein n=1 Tax=Pyxidicoccus parkwayensis TaxID=2813578 RepID=A0ABX7NUT0_9BACT|nr:S28 family serine protease [Pyxidicoccus parkwaysis]QSQ22550.1 hypothetical protein JY651_46835 [Pyxidicoccus parkwaysis]
MRNGARFDWARHVMGALLCAGLMACGSGVNLEPRDSAPGSGLPAEGSGLEQQSREAEAVDIRVRLESIPGLTVLSDTWVNGFRFFILDYEQPVDHQHPGGARFQQRLSLMHRSTAAPMVLDTEGAVLFAEPIPSEPADLLQANQLAVEHRYFGTSRPDSPDWSKLTVRQAAADIHRVVEAFKPLYRSRWLSTGVFKGGTAALTHRYFHPDDVHATVPYATHHSRGLQDERHAHFLRKEAGDSACREKLFAVQRAALSRREALRPFIEALAEQGFTFEVLGEDRALEFAVVELPFSFWEFYGFGWTCDDIPAANVTDEELFAWVSYVSEFEYVFSDQGMEEEAPLHYQQATELGGPGHAQAHLRPLLRYAGEDVPTRFPPLDVAKRYEPWTMLRVETWLRHEAKRVLLVYGDLSPWSASAFEVSARNDSYRVIATDSIGFYSTLSLLPEPQRGFLLGRLSAWAGVPVQLPEVGADTLRRAAGVRPPRAHLAR